MKKALHLTLLVLVLFLLTSCFYNNTSDVSKTINQPSNLETIGDTIIWSKVTNAVEYEIYEGNQLIATTDKTYYSVGDLNLDKNYQIKAIAKDGYIDSKLSKQITVKMNAIYTQDEIQTIYLDNDTTYQIQQSIKKVVVYMKSGLQNAVNTQLLMLERNDNLIIELNNVSMNAPDNKAAISTLYEQYSKYEINYSLTLVINGTNRLVGGNSNETPNQPSVNTGTIGLTGYQGKSAIIMSSIVIKGNGELELIGGNGGQGGVGADSQGLSTATYGNGGKGGDGGNGVSCYKYVINMMSIGKVISTGGDGGLGGAPGANGSIITGPINTGRWVNSYGDVGYKGIGFSGTGFVISGILTQI